MDARTAFLQPGRVRRHRRTGALHGAGASQRQQWRRRRLCQHGEQSVVGATAGAHAQSPAAGMERHARRQRDGAGTGAQLRPQTCQLRHARRHRHQLSLSALPDRRCGRGELLRLRRDHAPAHSPQRDRRFYVLRQPQLGERLHLARAGQRVCQPCGQPRAHAG